MNIKRYHIILVATISALASFARAIDNKTFERFYNLSPKELTEQRLTYIKHNQIDSAMLCSNILVSRYGREITTTEDAEACYSAFRFMGLQYLYSYCNYQLAAINLLNSERIADKYNFKQEQALISLDEAILEATRNDLENNFVYNKNVMDYFKKASYKMVDQTKADNDDIIIINMETTVSNLLYLAIKFDKTHDVTSEVLTYRAAKKEYGAKCNEAELFCNAIDYYNTGNYDKAFEVLLVPLKPSEMLSDRDFMQIQSTIKIAQYAVLVKSGKRAEALKLLLEHEQFTRDNGMPFEQLEALQLIWQHYQADGNKAMADKYALQYYVAKDEFINKSHAGKIDQAKLNLELEQTRERISEMNHRQQMQTLVLWGIAIMALLAMALAAVLWVNYRRTKRTNRLLYEKNIALLNDGKELRLTATPAPVAEHADAPNQDGPTQADRNLMDKITAVLESSPEVYGEDFSRQRLAELVDSNVKYVSRAINACKQCNFYMLLNEYRIKEACRRLMDTDTYGSYSLEGIANSVGYKSRSNFAAVFKNIVGLTPSAFQKMHREQGTAPTHPES